MISVLMATWNGEKYLSKQLDSLFAQSIRDFHIYISDDCSTDSTCSIVEEYRQRYPGRIELIRRSQNSGSAKHNFFSLMTRCKDDYVMLCDQDDFWLPDKIAVTLDTIRRMEAQYGSRAPLLVHTDVTVTDQNLRVLHPSYRQIMSSKFARTSLNYALVQNTFPGCACMYNRALSELIMREPDYCVMHDWWLMLIAAAFGHIGFTFERTALYRQHGDNSIGARDMRTFSYKFQRLLRADKIRHAIDITYAQAKNFLDMYRSRLSAEQVSLIEAYCHIPTLSKWRRIQALLHLNTLKNTLARRIGHFLFV